MSKKSQKKLSHKEFVERGIKRLRKPPYRGIHVVFSGFNYAFREYFGEDPRPILDKLVSEGFISLRPVKGGALIVLTSDLYESEKSSDDGAAVLGKILD